MIRRYLKISKFVAEATSKLDADQVGFGQLRPGVCPSSNELNALQQCVEVLTSAEQATALLGAEKSPTMHLVDVIISGVVKNLNAVKESTQPGTPANQLAMELRDAILKRRADNNSQCHVSEMFCQVATMLSPAYKAMTHVHILAPYSQSEKDALLSVTNICNVLFPRPPNTEVTSGLQGLHPIRRWFRLLGDGRSVAGTGNSDADVPARVVLLEQYRGYEMTAVDQPGDCPIPSLEE